MFRQNGLKAAFAVIALLGALALVASEADAKMGGGRSFGSRGTRTYSAPPPTQTAPGTAAPIERSMTSPTRPGTVGQAPAQAQGGLFGNRFGGFGGGLLAGFLGAGLLGMLFGGGLFGGLGSLSSFFGLLLQIGLIVIVARLLMTWWQRRNAGAYATASGPSLRDVMQQRGQNGGPNYGLGGGAGAAAAAGASENLTVSEADFNTFEKRLGEIETAYSEGDLNKLRPLVTPEMLGYLAEDLADNTSRGVVNEIRDVKLLQGDLAESWREGGLDYATVAMRFSMVDVTRERESGKIVDGSESPTETTELWTFMRGRGGDWILSAIQQA
jgi:predicted lipid-binding transport protein (Tim44 family)